MQNYILIYLMVHPTNTIVKNNIEFLNDKRYISDINENIPHTLYIE